MLSLFLPPRFVLTISCRTSLQMAAHPFLISKQKATGGTGHRGRGLFHRLPGRPRRRRRQPLFLSPDFRHRWINTKIIVHFANFSLTRMDVPHVGIGVRSCRESIAAHVATKRFLAAMRTGMVAQEGGIEEPFAANGALVALGRVHGQPMALEPLLGGKGLAAVGTVEQVGGGWCRRRSGRRRMTLAQMNVEILRHGEDATAQSTQESVRLGCPAFRAILNLNKVVENGLKLM